MNSLERVIQFCTLNNQISTTDIKKKMLCCLPGQTKTCR